MDEIFKHSVGKDCVLMETFEKTVLARLDKLVKKGWEPLVNLLEKGWHCNMVHKTFDKEAVVYNGNTKKISFGGQLFNPRDDLSPLNFHVREHKTMLDAIVAACDIAEFTKVNDQRKPNGV